MNKKALRPPSARPRKWFVLALGLTVVTALAIDPWGWWRDDQWFFHGLEGEA